MPFSPLNSIPPKQYALLNPFINHTFFTLRALSQHGAVFLFCPPLQIQLLLGTWNCNCISLYASPLRSKFWSILGIVTFLLFKIRLLHESNYLKLFRILSVLYLKPIHPSPTLVFYQDYLAETLSQAFPTSRRICELIINTTPSQLNYSSTLRAVKCSTTVVIPTLKLAPLCVSADTLPVLAPYGGDKIEYLSSMSKKTPLPYSYPCISSQNTAYKPLILKIAARSPSQRKGLDVFLHSILAVDSWLSITDSSIKLQIVICGRINEPSMLSLFSWVSHQLALRRVIHLSYRQFSSIQFTRLLAESDLFIMPSRLESSSLASLEALWHGVPSILTEACGIVNFCPPKHGLLLSQPTSSSLSRAMQHFLECPDRLHHCRDNLLADRDMFTWAQYLAGYSDLLGTMH